MAAKRLEGEDLLCFSAAPDNIPTMGNLLAPNIPSVPPDLDFFCFETSHESDLPSLPIPDGYIPSPPPPLPYAKDTSLSISMFFDGNLNLDSFEDAFCDMQSQGAVTKMLCSPPCIRYQFSHSSPGPAHVVISLSPHHSCQRLPLHPLYHAPPHQLPLPPRQALPHWLLPCQSPLYQSSPPPG